MQPSIAKEIDRYVRTGDHDLHHAAWPGGFLERSVRAHDDLRRALVSEVRRRASECDERSVPGVDTVALTRRKVEPMVRGLFPRTEQDTVLGVLERSVVFLTKDNIANIILGVTWHRSAWDLANLYLGSIGAQLLSEGAPYLVGISEETTCYVSLEYFAGEDPFADFLVHEAAHIFHNCKRDTAGLRKARTREWLLDIEFRKRETFAYACEAYARILERARGAADRRKLATQYAAAARISDERVDASEVAAIVTEAAAARGGWKIILARCAPECRPRSRTLRQ